MALLACALLRDKNVIPDSPYEHSNWASQGDTCFEFQRYEEGLPGASGFAN